MRAVLTARSMSGRMELPRTRFQIAPPHGLQYNANRGGKIGDGAVQPPGCAERPKEVVYTVANFCACFQQDRRHKYKLGLIRQRVDFGKINAVTKSAARDAEPFQPRWRRALSVQAIVISFESRQSERIKTCWNNTSLRD